jgi:plastocyanin
MPTRFTPSVRCVVVGLVCATVASSLGVASAAPGDLQGVVHVAGRAAKEVVIWLEAPAAAPSPRRVSATLDQRNMQFVPRVLAVRVGTAVTMPNSDRLLHNVFSFRDGKVFDLGLYPVGTSRVVTFDKAGLSRIYCNIHPSMGAYVVSVDSPYFAVSDTQGRFAIPSVPEGTYIYHVWRAGAEQTSGTLTAAVGHPVDIGVP